jgi:hypothetical protein
MTIQNTKYNINVTTYTIGLLEGYITQQEFELLCLIPKSQSKVTHKYSEKELLDEMNYYKSIYDKDMYKYYQLELLKIQD